jgi:ubiquinone/menaquinone biosynthesis C-methylase UbiE
VTEQRPTQEEIRAAWDALAAYWDENMEAGRTWQRGLIQPAVEELLRLEPGERVLEIACGNGEFSRRMRELGAEVLATDFSESMLERARAHGGDVEYRLADAADEEALLGLGEPESFDAVLCNMAIMDMADIEPMVAASSRLLSAEGRFVFSTLHPAFNSTATRMIEVSEDDEGVVRTYSVKVSSYIRPSVGKGVALEGQPVVQWYFHRPIGALFDLWFAHGFVLDGIGEPVLPREGVRPKSTSGVFVEVPPILVARMRPRRG